jgi:hypothetical protein
VQTSLHYSLFVTFSCFCWGLFRRACRGCLKQEGAGVTQQQVSWHQAETRCSINDVQILRSTFHITLCEITLLKATAGTVKCVVQSLKENIPHNTPRQYRFKETDTCIATGGRGPSQLLARYIMNCRTLANSAAAQNSFREPMMMDR